MFALGTVSHGTLRIEDLIPAFREALTDQGGVPPELSYDGGPTEEYWGGESEEAQWDLEELWDELNYLCPPYVYFGAHPDDPSDFGFWPDMDRLEMEVQYARRAWETQTDVPLEADEVILPNDALIVKINDHGNVTVMDMARNVLWECV